jgi:hypothetical protein
MKKNLITLLFIVAGFAIANAQEGRPYIKWNKSGGGFFGYKFVTTTYWPADNYAIVACSDPGFTRCRAHFDIVLPNGPNVSPETLEAIDKTVAALLTPENTSGSLVYNDQYFVGYKYDVDSDNLTFRLYKLSDARELGLIP